MGQRSHSALAADHIRTENERIGLARALYRRPALMALDEPNSNLDEAGDAALLKALLTLKSQGSTIIVVTHRPTVFAAVDKIIFMKEGAQKLFGPRDTVMKALLPQSVTPVQVVPAPVEPHNTASTGKAG